MAGKCTVGRLSVLQKLRCTGIVALRVGRQPSHIVIALGRNGRYVRVVQGQLERNEVAGIALDHAAADNLPHP